MQTDYCIVLITSPKIQSSDIANILVKEKLAACVNVVNDVNSIFTWEEKIDHATEDLLICKTKTSLFDKLCERVKKMHSYDNPEIIALPIIAGSQEYLKWVGETT